MTEKILEICIDSSTDLKAAILGGADRIELCQCMEVGGLTPSQGLMAAARLAPVPVHVMIRPRAGDFRYVPDEIDMMCADIAAAKETGLQGVVFGAVTADGHLHSEHLRILMKASQGLSTTLHRAFDLTTGDIETVIDQAVALRFDRILTSGRAVTAMDGLAELKRAFNHAGGHIAIMPGGGLRPHNLGHLLEELPVDEVHASCAVEVTQDTAREKAFGFITNPQKRVDPNLVREMKKILLSDA